MITVVVATDRRGGIGFRGVLPWSDVSYSLLMFRGVIGTSTIIMGRKTYEKLTQPITTRVVVVSKTLRNTDIPVYRDFNTAILKECCVGQVVLVGGQSIFQQGLQHNIADTVYVNKIDMEYNTDASFPILGSQYRQVSKTRLAKNPVVVQYKYVLEEYNTFKIR